jgi:hypothetical protein
MPLITGEIFMGGAEAKKHKTDHAETTGANDAKKADTHAKEAVAESPKGHAKGEKKAKEGDVKERQTFARERGSQWTLERCRKYARRFKTEAEWMAGNPSSYKAAAHWGWVKACCEHMTGKPSLVHSSRETAAASNYASNPVNLVVVPGNQHGHAKPTHTKHNDAAANVHTLEKKKSKAPASKTAKAKDAKKKAS